MFKSVKWKETKKFTLYQIEPASDNAAAWVDNHTHLSLIPTRLNYRTRAAQNSHLAARGATHVDGDSAVYNWSLSSYYDSIVPHPHYPRLSLAVAPADAATWARRRNWSLLHCTKWDECRVECERAILGVVAVGPGRDCHDG